MARGEDITTKFKLDVSDFKKGITEANKNIKLANAKFKEATAGMDDWANSSEGVEAKLKQLDSVLDEQKSKLRNYEDQLKATEDAQEENKKRADELKSALEQMVSQGVEKSSEEYKNYEKALHDCEKEASANETAADKLRIAVLNQSAAVKDSAADSRKYRQRLEEIEANSRDAANASDDLADNLDEAGNAAEDAGDGFTVMKGALADLIADGFKAAIDALKDFVNDSSEAYSKFQAATGSGTEEMQKFKDEMDDLYKNNYGESLSDIGDKMAYVKQVTGETDPSKIRELTENAIALEDTFGSDFNETVRGVNNMMQHFGLDSEEAFDLFAKGSQNGLDYTSELGDNVAEYGGNFALAGYSAEEYFQLLENGSKGGAYNLDKVNDSINEIKNRIGDGTIKKNLDMFSDGTQDAFKNWEDGKGTMKDVIDSIVNDISKAKSEEEALTLAQTAFGTMGEDANLDVVKSLTTLGDAYKDTKGTMEDLKQVRYDNVTSQFEEIKRTLQMDIVAPIAESVLPIINEFMSFIIKNGPVVVSALGGIVAGFVAFKTITFIGGLIGTVKTFFTLIKTGTPIMRALNLTVAANPFVLVAAAIAGLVAAFVILWKKSDAFRTFWIGLWDSIKKACQPVIDAIVKFMNDAWDKIKAVWDAAQPYFAVLWDAIKAVFAYVVSFFSGAFKTAWEAIKLVWDVVTGYFKTIWDTIKTVFSVVKSVLSGDFSGAWNAIKQQWDKVTGYFKNIWSGIKNVFSAVDKWFGNIFGGAWTAVKNAFSGFTSFFSGLWSSIKDTFSGLGTKIADAIGGSVKSGINSIINMIEDTINGAIDLINGAIDIINYIPAVDVGHVDHVNLPKLAKGGIVTKSTLANIGEDGPEAVVPLERNTQWIKKVAKQMYNQMNKGSSNMVNGLQSQMGSLQGGSLRNINNNFTQIINAPKQPSRLELYRQTRNLLALKGGN